MYAAQVDGRDGGAGHRRHRRLGHVRLGRRVARRPTLVGVGWQVVDGTITPPEPDELEDTPGDDI
jgi:hypothetical protein